MRAITVAKFGGPEVLQVSDVERPVPGPDEVLVRVLAAGVGPWDAYLRQRRLDRRAALHPRRGVRRGGRGRQRPGRGLRRRRAGLRLPRPDRVLRAVRGVPGRADGTPPGRPAHHRRGRGPRRRADRRSRASPTCSGSAAATRSWSRPRRAGSGISPCRSPGCSGPAWWPRPARSTTSSCTTSGRPWSSTTPSPRWPDQVRDVIDGGAQPRPGVRGSHPGGRGPGGPGRRHDRHPGARRLPGRATGQLAAVQRPAAGQPADPDGALVRRRADVRERRGQVLLRERGPGAPPGGRGAHPRQAGPDRGRRPGRRTGRSESGSLRYSS